MAVASMCWSALLHANHVFKLYMLVAGLIWAGVQLFSFDATPPVPECIYVTVQPAAGTDLGLDLGAAMFQYAALLGIGARSRIQSVLMKSSPLRAVFQFPETAGGGIEAKVKQVQFWETEEVEKLLGSAFGLQEIMCPDCFTDAYLISRFRNTTLQGAFQRYVYFEGYEELVEKQFELKSSVHHFIQKHYDLTEDDSMRICIDFDSRTIDTMGESAYRAFIEQGLGHFKTNLTDGDRLKIIATTDDATWLKDNSLFLDFHSSWLRSRWVREVVVGLEGESLARLALLWGCDGVLVCGGATAWWGAWGANRTQGAGVMYCGAHTVADGYYPPSWTAI